MWKPWTIFNEMIQQKHRANREYSVRSSKRCEHEKDCRIMKYYGTNIKPNLGDVVRFVEGGETMSVEDIIDSDKKMKNWGVEKHGLMLSGGSFGLLFNEIEDCELQLIMSAKSKSQQDSRTEPRARGRVD